jgi:hypothetical protein
MFRLTIRGTFTDIPLWRGRDGMRIPGFGLGDRIFHSGSALELGGGAVLDGDGGIGVSIGTTITLCLTMEGTTPGAGRFITVAPMLVADLHEAGRGLSMETGKRLEGSPHPADRAACIRARSAAMTMADRRGAFPHAEGRASVVEGSTVAAEVTEAVVDGGDGIALRFR